MKSKRGVILVIRDGWGYRVSKKDNALANTKTPFTDKLMKDFPNVLLDASGEAVGLPKGYQGNSEVGHMTLGSGRVINQTLSRINKSIKNRSFFENKAFLGAIKNCKRKKSTMHIAGLLQSEGVHAHEEHLFSLLEICKGRGLKDVKLHLFTDGRDAPVKDSLTHIKRLEGKLKRLGLGEIVSLSGRYYAMDRDKRWSRTKKAYEAIVNGSSEVRFIEAKETINLSHKLKVTDEFIVPRVKEGYTGMKSKDSFIFYNFRTDRPRQLMRAIVGRVFPLWKRKTKGMYSVAMTNYYNGINAKVAFPDMKIKNRLGQTIAKNKLKQLRISETEKYAHVTFFFNGQNEVPNKGEDRILIPSPGVATYDLKPEMSVSKIASSLVEEIKKKKYDLIVTNFVNGDMVGHTGKISAIKKAIVAVDKNLEKVTKIAMKEGYDLLILADHGNVEDQRPEWRTSHTTNPVPCILVSNRNLNLKNGKGLKDVAPTILDLLDLKKPKEMTGSSILEG